MTKLEQVESLAAHQGPVQSVFVISPIGSYGTPGYRKSLLVYDYIIKKALPESEGWDVMRADFESSPDSITFKVIKRIVECDLVVAVLTDRNANVFYELAVAHGYKKRVISLLEDGQDLPFDVADQRAIKYDLTDPESVDRAVASLNRSALRPSSDDMVTPLSHYARFAEVAQSTEDGGATAAMASLMADLTAQVAQIQSEMSRWRSSRHVEDVDVSKANRRDYFTLRDALYSLETKIAELEKMIHEGDDVPDFVMEELKSLKTERNALVASLKRSR